MYLNISFFIVLGREKNGNKYGRSFHFAQIQMQIAQNPKTEKEVYNDFYLKSLSLCGTVIAVQSLN
jgi:hypothetical protein